MISIAVFRTIDGPEGCESVTFEIPSTGIVTSENFDKYQTVKFNVKDENSKFFRVGNQFFVIFEVRNSILDLKI